LALHNAALLTSSRPQAAVGSPEASALPAPLRKIVTAFQLVPDPMTRYKQLLFYATRLKALPEALHTAENKVQGCVSQVWVVSELRAGAVYFQADSDSQLTKVRQLRPERVAPAPDARLKGPRGAACGRPQWLHA